METNEKMEIIKLLTEMQGLIVVNKLEMKDSSDLLNKAKIAAKKLSEEGIGNFDFSSDEKFEESLNDFLKVE